MSTRRADLCRQKEPVVLLDEAVSEELTHALVEQAREFGWRLVCLQITKGIIPTNVEPVGAILTCFPSHPLAAQLRAAGCPTVHVSHIPFADDVSIPHVYPDLFASGVLAADHFADRNFKHLAYIGKQPLGNFRAVFEGFQSRGRERGCKVHLLRLGQDLNDGSESVAQKRRARLQRHADEIGDWLEGLPKPVGYLAYSSYMAGNVCLICDDRNLKIPEKVAIVSRDLIARVSELAVVPLSSIDLNDDLQGRKALKLLKRVIDGESISEPGLAIPPKGLLERLSTNILAVEDQRVAAAIRYLWDNLNLPITDEDVARDVGVPYGTLRRLFRRHLGRSMNQELRRKRLEYCCELLRTTDMSVSKIVTAVGFRSPSHLHKTFREA